MRFSPSQQAFYDDDYELNSDNNDLPSDVVSLNDEEYEKYYTFVNDGCVIYLFDNQLLISSKKPDSYHTWDFEANNWVVDELGEQQKNKDLIAEAERYKGLLISNANAEISPLQYAEQLGMSNEDENHLLNKLKTYVVLLSRVDTSLAPKINWPPHPQESS